MNFNNNEENETVHDTLYRVMKDMGYFENPVTISTPLGSRTFYENNSTAMIPNHQHGGNYGITANNTWNNVKDIAADAWNTTKAATVGYASGATLGNFDEGMGAATAAVTLNPKNYTMGRDATRQLQNDLQQQHPWAYGVGEFVGTMTTPMHLVKGENFKQKAFNAFTDTLNASAGYAENWNDFGTNLAVNGIANNVGLIADKIPLGRAAGRPLVQFGKKIFKQGINSSADKMKNMYYKKDEDEEEYYY